MLGDSKVNSNLPASLVMSKPVERTHRIAPDLFLSYARQDLAEARRLAEEIEARGYTVAMDVNDVAPGEDWQARLDQLLQGAAKLLFLASLRTRTGLGAARGQDDPDSGSWGNAARRPA
jgi:hypothetical protein